MNSKKYVFIILVLFYGIIIILENGISKNSEYLYQKNNNEYVSSNIDLDNIESKIMTALQDLFEEKYGDNILDARMYIEKIYTKNEEKEIVFLKDMNLGLNEYAFELRYDIKPVDGVSVDKLIDNGFYDNDNNWIMGINKVGIIRISEKNMIKYKIIYFDINF